MRVLEGLDIVDGAPAGSLERIAADIDEHDLPAGTAVIRDRVAPDDLFVIRSGTLSVTVTTDTSTYFTETTGSAKSG